MTRMSMSFTVALLLLVPAGVRGQISESDAAVFVGCYEVEVGEWSVEVAPETASAIPAAIELEGPPVASRRQQGGHVRTTASLGGAARVRRATGESIDGWSWMTTNARSVRIAPPGPGFALLGVLRDDERVEGRALPARARLADTKRDDFVWAAVTLVPVECGRDARR